MRQYQDKEWLEQKYLVEKLSPREMAGLTSCERWAIGYWLKKHGIERRRRRSGVYKICELCGKEFYVRPSRMEKARFCSKSCAAKAGGGRPSQKVTLVCDFCGKSFKVAPSRAKEGQRFCFRQCYMDWQKEHPRDMKKVADAPRTGRVEIVCEWCGKSFKVSPSRAKQHNTRFCSNGCYSAWKKGRPRPDLQSGTTVTCEICGKDFRINTWQVENMDRRFCSKECRGVWMSKNFSGEQHPQWTGGDEEVERICENCDKSFTVLEHCLRRGDNYGLFCSKDCLLEFQKAEKHPRWLGSKSFEPYPPTFNKAFKRMIRERDDYTCAVCGLEGVDAHHINYVKDDTNPDNCILLCKSCHGATSGDREYWPCFLVGLMWERQMLSSLVGAS